jgi:hypothetical protein
MRLGLVRRRRRDRRRHGGGRRRGHRALGRARLGLPHERHRAGAEAVVDPERLVGHVREIPGEVPRAELLGPFLLTTATPHPLFMCVCVCLFERESDACCRSSIDGEMDCVYMGPSIRLEWPFFVGIRVKRALSEYKVKCCGGGGN